jgi:predicted acylesterase/phospholipase RssA
MPVDVLAADAEGPIIAVDVGSAASMKLHMADGLVRGDGPVRPWDEDRRVILPGLGEQLMRIVTLGSADGVAMAEKYASLVIRPEHDGVGMLEFHMIDRMRASGRRAARAALAAAADGASNGDPPPG